MGGFWCVPSADTLLFRRLCFGLCVLLSVLLRILISLRRYSCIRCRRFWSFCSQVSVLPEKRRIPISASLFSASGRGFPWIDKLWRFLCVRSWRISDKRYNSLYERSSVVKFCNWTKKSFVGIRWRLFRERSSSCKFGNKWRSGTTVRWRLLKSSNFICTRTSEEYF